MVARGQLTSEATAKHAEAKIQLLHIRIEEKRRNLVLREDVDARIDAMAGTMLTHLSGMAARCSRDIVVRRNARRGGDADQARNGDGMSRQGG
jgi:hypothetical protein